MWLTRRQLLRGTAAGSLALAGCGGDGGDGGQTAAPAPTVTAERVTPARTGEPADATVVKRSVPFRSVEIEVAAGATVRWVNDGGSAYTVRSAQFHDTARPWRLEERVSGDGSVTHTFEERGVYEFYCTINHEPTMCGAVLVGGATLDGAPPCSEGFIY
ncbi:MAG: plastocyanin/azurin family copper-binding protein [Halobacteriales archaeon]